MDTEIGENISTTPIIEKNVTNHQNDASNSSKRSYPTSAQDKLKEEIQVLEKKLNTYYMMRDNLNNVSKSDIDRVKKEVQEKNQKLKSTISNANYQKNYRDNKKKN